MKLSRGNNSGYGYSVVILANKKSNNNDIVIAGTITGLIRMWNLDNLDVTCECECCSPPFNCPPGDDCKKNCNKIEWEVEAENNYITGSKLKPSIVGLVHMRHSNNLLSVTKTGVCSVWNLDNIISRSFGNLNQPTCLHTINIWDNLIDNWAGKYNDPHFYLENKPYITGISSLSYKQFNNISYNDDSHQKINNVLGDDEYKIGVSISTGESIGFNILKNSCLCCNSKNYSEIYENKTNAILNNKSRSTCIFLSRMSFLHLQEIKEYQMQQFDLKREDKKRNDYEQAIIIKNNPKVEVGRPCVAITPNWPGNFICYTKNDTSENCGTELLIGNYNQKLNTITENSDNISYMTQTKDICHTLPGYILSATPKDNEITVSENLNKFLTSRSKSCIDKSKSCDVLFMSKEGIISYNTVVSTLYITKYDNTIEYKITLVDTYHGPKIENGLPRVYIRTNLKSIDNIHSILNKSCEIIKNKDNKIKLETRITALAAHEEYPYIIAGLSNDKITLIIPDWNKGIMKDIKQDEEDNLKAVTGGYNRL